MNTLTKLTSTIALATLLAVGAAGCSTGTDGNPAPAVAETASPATPEDVVSAIEAFVAATTTDKVAEDFAATPNKSTFDQAVKLIDPEASVEKSSAALSDFALVKFQAPKAKVSITVDVDKVAIEDQSATVPVSAVVVSSDGKKVANSDALADQVNDLVLRDGAWVISFPEAAAPAATPSATVSAAPSASATAAK